MLKTVILVLGLASSLIGAAPSYVATTDNISDANKAAGSVSDNACRVEELPYTAPTFRHPARDVCVDIEALRKVKIYSAATCQNGTEALFARYRAPGCVGEPAELQAIGEELLGACLSMPSRGAGSYGFWCDGVEERAPLDPAPASPPQYSSGGGFWGLIGILLLIFVTMLLIAVLKLVSFISRATHAGNKFLGIFGQREGGIALR
ncbi:hypothetical protein PFICI_00126 [Pestalotiopsis fici W106-1]|uniref:Autophagy-related protein 27 n=1 Tax=Pestalotiopsis fici (strain W106-1 / CGMCC3.15140) TaxID=1229662 RepID=W3XJT9_PESFW|nr:uncharacterized protein PFICI_00126 [Pestalotiopsis fici W106-1]ETS86298.1 hypothetical protein PFICI_00126 [Pestalotiopsis fici W106-1]